MNRFLTFILLFAVLSLCACKSIKYKKGDCLFMAADKARGMDEVIVRIADVKEDKYVMRPWEGKHYGENYIMDHETIDSLPYTLNTCPWGKVNIDHKFIVCMTAGASILHVLGLFSAVQAIMKARTSQGAIAWAISLVTLPYISLPFFWIFGRDRFFGYTIDRRDKDSKLSHIRKKLLDSRKRSELDLDLDPEITRVLEGLAAMRFNRGNAAELCIDGKATFEAIFKAIDSAKEYLLIQFFIIHDDELGRAFKVKLIEAASRGVRVYVLYDEIGSHKLPKQYINDLQKAGISVRPFKTTKGAKNRFQINFRNHRKIVIADGKIGLVGGHNVGDEYLGKDVKFGHWRDTHVRIEGDSVLQIQASYVEDWHWSSGEVPDLKWEYGNNPDAGKAVLILPTGPADTLDTCCLFFLQAINAAKKRIWITSPYFVPDPQIVSALQLAAMRGVEVKILIPCKADHLFVYLASFSFLKETVPLGINLFRYQNGFIHEKVLLVDDYLSAVGTANFDNRSFRLNFEITAIFSDKSFAGEVEKMLVADFKNSKPVSVSEIEDRSYFFKLSVRVAKLMSPIL